ncbi:MAG: hypothetical protein ACKPKO_04950, partial [Candidatus Fonsibacter sp.]
AQVPLLCIAAEAGANAQGCVAVLVALFLLCFAINGYDELFWIAGYQHLDLARRVEALVEHRFCGGHGSSLDL